MECIGPERRFQDRDTVWIRDAEKNKLVVGTQARILYQDAMGRMKIALKFNEWSETATSGRSCSDATITTPAARILRSAKTSEYQRRQ